MIRFLRQMAGLPYVVTGFYLTAVGDFFTDVGSWIEGADAPITAHALVVEEVPKTDGTTHAA